MKDVLYCRFFVLPGVPMFFECRTGVEKDCLDVFGVAGGLRGAFTGDGSGVAVIGVDDSGCGVLPNF